MTKTEPVTARNVDLSNCDREQIQYAAATLEHGFLLVLDEPDLTVLQAGANAAEFLGRSLDRILHFPVESWLDRATAESLRHTVARLQSDTPPLHVGIATLKGKYFDVFVHRCNNCLIAEFETRNSGAASAQPLFPAVHAAINKLQQAATVEEFLDRAVSQIREFTGFDRVMAYQFLEDGSGAVRAESAGEEWEPFLGLHYPASDVPIPARRLFKMTWLRHQPDIGYTPVPIVPADNPRTGEPLDLSYALLRSVSVMYSRYLKNMGTQSSMVMTLLRNGELWGLIACHHHRGPCHVPFEHRVACEFLAHMISLLLSAKEEQESAAYLVKLKATQAGILSALSVGNDIATVLMDRSPGLLDFVDATGAAVVLDGRPTLVGVTPDAGQVKQLAEWLEQQTQDVFHTDCLSRLYPPALDYASAASGVLAVRAGTSQNDFLLWFRPEFQHTVKWAGNPHKPVDVSEDGQRLMPRASFAIWKEQVRHRAQPWKTIEIKAAGDLRNSLLELAVRHAVELQALYRNVQRTNVELDAFAYIASHDLKEPLRGIHNYTQFLLEDVGETLPPDAIDKLNTVVRLTRRMDDLLDSLLRYSRLGQQGMEVARCDMNELIAEVLDTLAPRVQQSGVEVRVLGPLPIVTADSARIGEVLMNLVSNAIKYNDKDRKIVEIGCSEAGGEPEFFVRDNGIGIPKEHHETIFGIFRRLHPPNRFGGGTGAGLTIARKILERHEGRICVESAPGLGSTFRFTIGTK